MAKARPTSRNGAHSPNGEKPKACYVLSLEIENVRCFGPKQKLDLSDGNGRPAQWTIILGENGTGKTTLLQALVLLESVEADHLRKERLLPVTVYRFLVADALYGQRGNGYDPLGMLRGDPGTRKSRCQIDYAFGHDLQSVDDTHLMNSYWEFDGTGASAVLGTYETLHFAGYGASRRLGRQGYSQAQIDDPVGTLFDDHAALRNAEEWLLRLDYAAKSTGKKRDADRLEQIKQLLIPMLPGVEDIRFRTTSGPNPKQWVEFNAWLTWVPLRRLGYGYQTLVAWVLDFFSRMVERYPDSPDPLKEPAIVVVDEIDLHLHPMWQRKLIGDLSEWFPNTQFIATAHSPLVVQAAENANIAVLKRVGDHVEIDNNVDEIRNWRVDQILTSDLFGLPTARPPETERLLARKQKLLDKPKRTKADAKELKELQDKIDRLPVGDSAAEVKEMDAIRNTIDLLKKHLPK